jgi:putative endonuclease
MSPQKSHYAKRSSSFFLHSRKQNLVRRIFEHKFGVVDAFTKNYGIHQLVYFEQFDGVENAIRREKRIKKWNESCKIRLIEESNPNWIDLYPNLARQ